MSVVGDCVKFRVVLGYLSCLLSPEHFDCYHVKKLIQITLFTVVYFVYIYPLDGILLPPLCEQEGRIKTCQIRSAITCFFRVIENEPNMQQQHSSCIAAFLKFSYDIRQFYMYLNQVKYMYM